MFSKETVIGTITHEDVKVTAMHPEQRCIVALDIEIPLP